MSSQDRAIWDDIAAKDKERWEIEKILLRSSGSCGQEARPKKKQDVPRAAPPPTRPSSAYFSFMKLKRGQVKQGNPSLSPAEVTRIASQMWHDLTFSERGLYLQQEARAMEVYKIAMKKWQDGNSQGTLVPPQRKENGLQRAPAEPRSSPKKKRRRITPPAKKTLTQSDCVSSEIIDVDAEQTNAPDRVPVPDGLLSSGEVKPQKPKITVTAKSLRLRNRKRQREQHKMFLQEVDTKPLSSAKQAEKSKPAVGLLQPIPVKSGGKQAEKSKPAVVGLRQPSPIKAVKKQAKKSKHAVGVRRPSANKSETECSIDTQTEQKIMASTVQALDEEKVGDRVSRPNKSDTDYTQAEIVESEPEMEELNARIEDRLKQWHGYTLGYQRQMRQLRDAVPDPGLQSAKNLPNSELGGLDYILMQKKEELEHLAVRLIEDRQVARTNRIYGNLLRRNTTDVAP